MNKNAPAAQDAMFALQSVADISNEAGQKCFTWKAPSSMIFR